MTLPGTTMGSVQYMSPEQARGEPATERSDIYSLGVVLFEMLAGRRPFEGDSAAAIAVARLTPPVPMPSTHRAGIPPVLEAICRKAMAIDPAERFQTATAMAAALDDEIADRALPAAATAATVAGAAGVAAVGVARANPPAPVPYPPDAYAGRRRSAGPAPGRSRHRARGRRIGPMGLGGRPPRARPPRRHRVHRLPADVRRAGPGRQPGGRAELRRARPSSRPRPSPPPRASSSSPTKFVTSSDQPEGTITEQDPPGQCPGRQGLDRLGHGRDRQGPGGRARPPEPHPGRRDHRPGPGPAHTGSRRPRPPTRRCPRARSSPARRRPAWRWRSGRRSTTCSPPAPRRRRPRVPAPRPSPTPAPTPTPTAAPTPSPTPTPTPTLLTVGEYRCQTLGEAKADIAADGFVVGTVTPQPAGLRGRGRLVRLRPAAAAGQEAGARDEGGPERRTIRRTVTLPDLSDALTRVRHDPRPPIGPPGSPGPPG